jgi:hypothetical protein
MKRLLISRCLVAVYVVLSLLVLPGLAFSWGSATHAYLVKKALGDSVDPSALYGATAPDMFENGPAIPIYGVSSQQTHSYPMKIIMWAGPKGLGPFALGFISHNEVRGADFYAHKRGMTTRTGYVTAKVLRLKGTVQAVLETVLTRAGIPAASLIASQFAEDVAHPLVETAIDILVRYGDDQDIAYDLALASLTRPPSVPGLLVRSFGLAVSERTGLNNAAVGKFLMSSEEGFRESMIQYAEALGTDEPEAVLKLADMGARIINAVALDKIGQDIGLLPEDLVPLIYSAMAEAEKDYRNELERVTSRLKGYLKIWRTILER